MIQRKNYFIRLLFFSMSFISLIQISAQSVWRQSSYDDFKNGTFLDAGSNCYVSAKGRIQIITRWDFNNDGKLDFFLPSGHGHTEKENTYIYLNNSKDIDARSRIELPGGGSRDGLVADFNKDGLNDLAVVNFNDSHARKIPAWIYYGTNKGFTPNNRIELPAADGTAIVAGDFNGDSWLDLVVGCQYWGDNENENAPKKSFIYWNSPKGFNSNNRLAITLDGLGAIALASKDIDGDGKDDLLFLTKENLYLLLSTKDVFKEITNAVKFKLTGSALSIGDMNNDKKYDIAVCTKEGVLILKGQGKGNYDLKESILLPVSHSSDVALADMDKDGFDDVVVANLETTGGATWTDSYLFYSDGNDFTKRKPLKLPTLGASGVSCGDLNNDGYPEIVFSNQYSTNEHDLLSYVYWNEKGTFRFEDHTQLLTQGSMANTIGDVNNDGSPDVIFFNNAGYFSDGAAVSTVYWGDGTRNYSKERSTEINTHQVFGFGNADLDDDGNVEIIMAMQAYKNTFVENVNHDQAGLVIEWSKADKFNEQTNLTMNLAYGGVRIADINRDGYLDILAGGDCVDLNDPAKHGFPIFWGSTNGYSFKNRTVLHFNIPKIRGPLLMDLNKDGWLDIAAQVEFGKIRFWWGGPYGFKDERITELDLGRKDELMYLTAADVNNDGWLDLFCPHRAAPEGNIDNSYLYFGSPKGFSNDNRILIPSYVPYQNCFADINKDGWLDLVLTSYGGEVSGNRPSLIYWGSKDGFKKNPTELETYGSSGVEVLDYDGDGWLDILFADHRKSGSYIEPEPHRHICPSLLYWGGPNGFSKNNRSEFMAVGPSGLNLRDPGNSYDRGLYEDYISVVHQINKNEIPSSIKWEAETPFGTSVKFQIRAADSEKEIQNAEWQGPAGSNSWFTKTGSEIKELSGKFIQYRARLITPNDAATPYLTSVELTFSKIK
ncbi:MAG: VCBS repeat-containing protein [Ignavibacteriales bacterium]|nr:VCBS repeat-containing protein [Ignavibacteriales bacterium]